MIYVVERGLPIPPDVRGRKKGTPNVAGLKSALRQLEVGDCMLIKASDQFGLTHSAKVLGISVTGRKTEDGLRVWRLS